MNFTLYEQVVDSGQNYSALLLTSDFILQSGIQVFSDEYFASEL